MFRVAFKAIRSLKPSRLMTGVVAATLMALTPAQFATPAQAANNKYAAYVIDVKSGKVLFARNSKSLRYPASLTKMMTLYMVFEELDRGRLKLDSRLKVSKYAASRPPSKLGLRAGSTIRVRDAIYALVTKSANDVATTVAENIGGTESNFAAMMTRKARSMGMNRTTFKNASGLPNRNQKTTAADMALLGRALQDRFPHYYSYFKTRSFKYGKRRYGNHNRLLGTVKGVDGIKTGYTRASGFNLVSNVKHRNRHIVAVVMGGKTGRSRNAHMRSLIAKYLPKAKAGRRQTALVVPRSYKGNKGTSRIQLAATMRLPKPKSADLILASANSTKQPVPAPASTPVPAPIQLASVDPASSLSTLPKANRNRLIVDPTATAAVSRQQSKLTVASLSLQALPRAANDPIGDLSTHMTPQAKQAVPVKLVDTVNKPKSGWQIQLAATPTLGAAKKILDKARAKNKRLLVAVSNYTETVEKGDAVLYRARFAGFSSKKAARNTCKILKKQKFACLALNP